MPRPMSTCFQRSMRNTSTLTSTERRQDGTVVSGGRDFNAFHGNHGTSSRGRHTEPVGVTSVRCAGRNGSGSSVLRVLLYGVLLLCLFAPQCTEAQFTCPSVCTCITWKPNGVKMQNITCSGQGLTEVPKDGKNGADVFKLDISNNQISSLTASDFQYFVNLVELDLSFNQLTSIATDTFTNLTSLQHLTLAGNTLSVSADLFGDTFIEYLDISNMGLTAVSKQMFAQMTLLRTLNLAYNNITYLPQNLFSKLPVETVNFHGNDLRTLGKNVFKDSSLHNIDLSYNQISSVAGDFLDDADMLTNLDLSNNFLTSLTAGVFNDVPMLETLRLSNNLLNDLHFNIFKETKDLRFLDISNNDLTTISISLLYTTAEIDVDFSSNPFSCDCTVRDFLYGIRYDALRNLLNEDQVKCTDNNGNNLVFLDYWLNTCDGILGASCRQTADCMVRNSECNTTSSECVCRNVYYDNNGVTTAGGLCKPQVYLDSLCDMNEACLTEHAECISSKCLCTHLYYDTSPIYLGGVCELRKELGESCTMDIMCLANHSMCGSSNVCVCQSAYYDSNSTAGPGGECLAKLPLHSSCNETYQCATSNTECTSNTCTCMAGFYDLLNVGQCQGPEQFYSCSPDNSSSDAQDVHFTAADVFATERECKEYCFKQDAPYYLVKSGVCVCGINQHTSSCCPMVQTNCQTRNFIGPNTEKSIAGINITHVPQLYAGAAHEFSVDTTLQAIDQIVWKFGDSVTEHLVSGSSSSMYHTYTHAGQFWLTVQACVQSVSVCEEATITVRVQVPPANLTTFITATSNHLDVNSNMTNFFATFYMGYDFSFFWSKTDSNGYVTKKQGCPTGWHAHRYSCIKLVSTSQDFDTAQSNCVAEGGKLLQFDFMEELQDIVSILSASATDLLVGAQRMGGVWQWKHDGSRTVFSNKNLLDTSLGDCAVLRGSNHNLTTVNCATPSQSACISAPVSCPKGGELYDSYCYALETTLAKNWTMAQTSCETQYGGWLANITEAGVQTAVTRLLTGHSASEAWFGLSDRGLDEYYVWADGTSFNYHTASYKPTVTSNTGDCFATTSTGTWYSDRCSFGKPYVCQYSENIERVTVPSFMNGVPNLGISGATNLEQLVATDTFSDPTIDTNVILFPGLIFSRGGSLRSWIFRSVNVAAGDTYDISFQVYRPSCATGHLYQPACAGTKFATCSPGSYVCSSHDCSSTQYHCYLGNKCKSFNESCTCNTETSASAFCSNIGTSPTYTVMGQTQITVSNSGEQFYTVPAGNIPIEEFDVIGIQVPAGRNVIKCESVPSSPDDQITFNVSHAGWLDKRHDFPSGNTQVEQTCYIQALYTQQSKQQLPQNLGFSSTIGQYDLSIAIVESETENLSVNLEESVDDVFWVYPGLDLPPIGTSNLGTVYTYWNQVYEFTVRVERGTNLVSHWSFDRTQSIHFTDSCPPAVAANYTNLCNASLYWSEKPFANFTYQTSTLGEMNLTLDIINSLGLTQKTLTIKTEKIISGLGIYLATPSLIPNNIAKDQQVHFATTLSVGTGLTYQFFIDGALVPSTNSSLFYTFPAIQTYNVEVRVDNIVSSQSESITVYVKQPAEASACTFLNTPYVAAVGIPITLSVQCSVNSGAEVHDVWVLGDRPGNITGATTTTTSTTYTWSQTVTFSTVQAGVKITATVSDPFEQVASSTSVDVYNAIPYVSVSNSGHQVEPSDIVSFIASVPTSPGNYGTVTFTFDYGDGTTPNTSTTGIVSHTFATSGNYTVNVTASNGPSTEVTTQHIEVYDKVAGLTLTYNGPKQVGHATTFTASTTSGNFLSYHFSSTVFDMNQASNTFTFNFSSPSDYNVTLNVSNALSSMQTSIMAYIMSPMGIRIASFNLNGTPYTGCVETNVLNQYSVEVIHYDITKVTYNWNFDNGIVLTGLTQSSTSQGYTSSGNYSVAVTANYSPASSSVTKTVVVCVQDRIRSPQIQIEDKIGLPVSGMIKKNVTLSYSSGTGLHYTWSTNTTAVSATTDSVFQVTFSAEGWYEVSVNVSNYINTEIVTKIVQVVEEASGLTITCGSCVMKGGEYYIRNATDYMFNVAIATGSQVTYSMDFGDGTTLSGPSNTYMYTTVGIYNLTITATNPVVAALEQHITLHVEVPITDVTLSTYLYSWISNIVGRPTHKSLNILNTAVVKADVAPSNMEIEYDWVFNTGMNPITNMSNVGYHNYTSIGLKSCTVTARNSLGQLTSQVLNFYIIEEVTQINVTENGSLLLSTAAYIVAVNSQYTFTATSTQIVPQTEKYLFTLRKNGSLVGSSPNNNSFVPAFTYNFTNAGTYEMHVIIGNSLKSNSFSYNIEAIEPISGPFINSSLGTNSNMTLGSSVTLFGYSLVGKHLQYQWLYASAPLGQSLPVSSDGQNITITPGVVGLYVITLEVYNSISVPQRVNYTFNVMVGVTGASIDASLPFPGAIEKGESLTLTARVRMGTGLGYSWEVFEAGTSIATGNQQTITVTFSQQAIYNVTLLIENYASSGSAFFEIYSLDQVPAFSLQVTGALFIGSKNIYASKTGDGINFTSTLTNKEFIDFDWKVNGSTQGTEEYFTKVFTQPADYIVNLDAYNKISNSSSAEVLTVQDPVTGLVVQFCHSTFKLYSSVTLTANVASGTGIEYEWVGDTMSSTHFLPLHIIQFNNAGLYSLNVTAKNYVSQETQYCLLDIQGEIANLRLTNSQYQFVSYPVTFTVTGDYIDSAKFTWVFSNGVNQTTTVPTTNIKFSNQGNYSVMVVVSNAVSNASISMSFYVEQFVCSVPVLSVDGSRERTTLRARTVEFTVSVSTGGCTNYTSINSWVVYSASSCSQPLNNQFILSSSIQASTPVLQIPGNSLDYGTYCVEFKHSYANTPVEKSELFNLTITSSDLKALILGGDQFSAPVATSLTVDATESYDPDDISTNVLTYSWACTQTMGTPVAADVCTKINSMTSAVETLTGLTLTPGDLYTVTVTVSAAGRTNGVATQQIYIVPSTTPVVATKCVSCIANGHFFMTTSKSLSIEGRCLSGCTLATTYSWIVTDVNTNTVLPINSALTTTGSSKQNFVLKANALPSGGAYSFKLSATEGTETGEAMFSLPASTKPTGGSCTVTPTSPVTPLEDLVNVSCQNFNDADAMSGIYYQVMISSNSVSAEKYLAYYGTRAENEIYVAPFPSTGTGMGTIQVEVNVINDYGAMTGASSTTISFNAVILSGNQNDTVDFVVDQMVTNMKTIVKQNNPVLLVQYCTAVLSFLNEQSLNNVGLLEKRTAIRQVISKSLAGLPRSSIHNIQQISSAIKYLTAYPDELSEESLENVNIEIKALAAEMESIVIKGHDKTDFEPDSLLTAVNKIQEALRLPTKTSPDSSTLLRFGDLNDYILDVSQSQTAQGLTQQAMIIKTVEYNNQLMVVPLKAQLADEDPVEKTMSDGTVQVGMHVSVDSIESQFDRSGVKVIVPADILSHTSYSKSSVFQLLAISAANPYNFGYNEKLPLNTKTLSTSFYDTSGSSLAISNLPDSANVQMYMFDETSTPYNINSSGLVFSADYNPLVNNFDYTKSSILDADTQFEAAIPLPSVLGAAVNIQIRANFTTSQSTDTLRATLYKNGVPYSASDANVYARPLNINKTIIDNQKHDHRAYTFYIPPSDISSDDAIKVRVTTSSRTEVFIGTYNTKCEFFNIASGRWETDGCVPQAESIPVVISCKCNHMTSFGGALFVSPDEIDFTDLTNIDIADNPVAVITCSVVLFIYIVVVIACRRMDILDVKRISHIPLCGKDGSFKYEVTVVTGRLPGAGTSAHVGIRLVGEYGKSARQHVSKAGAFQRNCSDTFIVAYDVNLGDLRKIHVWHDNTGKSPSWYLSHVIVNDLQTDQKYYFFAHRWFSLEMDNGTIDKEIRVAGAREMTKFGHRMSTALFNSLADKHLWLSLLNRPAQSRFTRVQRATCCVTILFVFIGVNAMWYGLLKKDNTDLGWTGFGWEEVVLGLVSNVMVLPFSIGLVFLFKKSRSSENLINRAQRTQTAQTLEIENLCGNSQAGSFESSNTGAIPDDLERESTMDSNYQTGLNHGGGGLRRSRNVTKTHRENTEDSLLERKRPNVAVTKTSSSSPLWNEDGILKWPDQVPSYGDGDDSRPSTSSTAVTQPAMRHLPNKPGGSNPAAARKSKTLKGKEDAGQLLEYLDKLENDLKESESKSIKSSGSKKSTTSLRKPSMQRWGSLEDILQSDDESIADISRQRQMRKRGSTTSQASTVNSIRKFNPRADARIQGSGGQWLKSGDSMMSATTRDGGSFTQGNGITAGMRPGYYSEMTMESRDIPIHSPMKEKCSLPSWCIYIGYTLCFVLSVFSIIMVILYCFKFGYEESVEWVLAFILSLVMSALIIEPLKAFLIAVYVVAMLKNVEQEDDDDCIDIGPSFDSSNEKIKDVKFKPISGFALLQAKEEGRKVHRMNVMLRQFIAYMFYLWLLIVICFVHFRYDTYLMTKHMEHDFMVPTTVNGTTNFTNMKTMSEFWDWTETVFVDSLYLGNTQSDEEHAVLLGAARARLIRGLTSSCWAEGAATRLGASVLTDRTCHGHGQYEEDTADYAEGWNGSNSNNSWKHFSASQLGSTHKIGHVATYPGGGYPQNLGTSYFETLTVVQDLKAKGWVDLLTRAVIFEFAMYSPGTDMTSMVALLVEFPLTGGVIATYEIQTQKLMWFQENHLDPLMILQAILLVVVVYSWIHTALRIRECGRPYFKDIWNYYEILTTLMATVSIGMYMGCVIEATGTFDRLIANQTDFTNFERAMYIHVGTRYLQAWLLFLLMYKVVKQLRFIKVLHIYEKTLSNAVGYLLGAGLIFFILLLAYAQLGYLMYGRLVAGFESVGHTIVTLIVMIRGTFDFWPMLDYHPVFSHFYVFSYYGFAYGILMGLIIAILQSTYKVVKSQTFYKATLEMQDYEMIDFMMKRFQLWAGIKKEKPAFRRVKFQGLPSISSRSSSSYSNRSSATLQSSQSVSDREFSQVQLKSMMARMGPTWQAVLKRMEKIETLDKDEETLVKKAEHEMKELNWKCRINELERQTKEILNWKNPNTGTKPPAGDSKHQRQSILKRLAKDNQERKAPATVTGATSRTAVSTPLGTGTEAKTTSGRRPFSDQGTRVEVATNGQQRRSSSQEKSTLQKFFKSVKPSKSAWNK